MEQEWDDIPVVTQPKSLRKNLYRHQLASIHRMEKLEIDQLIDYEDGFRETRLGINADYTGYGKTLSMIGLIVRDKMLWDMETPFTEENITTGAAGLIKTRKIYRYDKLPSTLILMSASIVSHWKQELSFTDLKVGIVDSKHQVEYINVEEYDVIIVTSGMYNALCLRFQDYAWKRFIFDEPGHIRITGMKDIHAGFIWFITATPEAIALQHKSCRSSFMKKVVGDCYFTNFSDQYSGIIIRNNIDYVKASFVMPQTFHYYHNCVRPIVKAVSGMVNSTILTMVAAGNIKGAIDALGGKSSDNIIELVKSQKLEKITRLEREKNQLTDEEKIKELTRKIDSIKVQIDELNSRFESILLDNCVICTEPIRSPVMEPNCQHVFCGECLLTWLKTHNNCPTCRSHINNVDLVYINNEKCNSQEAEKQTRQKKFTPNEKVVDLICSNPSRKFIIYSSYDFTFELICRSMLELNDITYTTVRGTWKSRSNAIESFKYGDTQVIFLNSSYNAAGINLQEATDIILYHEMEVSTQNQIIGRANRIGRTVPLNVHHIVSEK